MKKTVHIRPDIAVASIGSKGYIDRANTVKMTCDCGWEEKSTLHNAEPVATRHLNDKHNGGNIRMTGVNA